VPVRPYSLSKADVLRQIVCFLTGVSIDDHGGVMRRRNNTFHFEIILIIAASLCSVDFEKQQLLFKRQKKPTLIEKKSKHIAYSAGPLSILDGVAGWHWRTLSQRYTSGSRTAVFMPNVRASVQISPRTKGE
jgi:hypothetical protein